MNRTTTTRMVTVALLAGWGGSVAVGQSVSTRIDLSGIISDPARRQATTARLTGRLARELRGERTAATGLDLVVRFVKGRLVCEMYLRSGGKSRSRVGSTVLDTLAELPEVASRLSGSPKLWMARAVRPSLVK